MSKLGIHDYGKPVLAPENGAGLYTYLELHCCTYRWSLLWSNMAKMKSCVDLAKILQCQC